MPRRVAGSLTACRPLLWSPSQLRTLRTPRIVVPPPRPAAPRPHLGEAHAHVARLVLHLVHAAVRLVLGTQVRAHGVQQLVAGAPARWTFAQRTSDGDLHLRAWYKGLHARHMAVLARGVWKCTRLGGVLASCVIREPPRTRRRGGGWTAGWRRRPRGRGSWAAACRGRCRSTSSA